MRKDRAPHQHHHWMSLLLVVLLLITALGYPLSELAARPLDLRGREITRILTPKRIGPLLADRLPLGEVTQFLNNVRVKIFGTGSNIGVKLAVRNDDPLRSVTFSPRRGGFFNPGGGGIQGMVIAGATVTLLGGFNAAPALKASPLQERDTEFTVPPGEMVEVLVDAVCINYYNEDRTDTMPVPPAEEVDFIAEEPGQGNLLTEAQNQSLTSLLDVLADVELLSLIIIGDPELASEIFLLTAQWSIWAVTDGLTYVQMKKHLEEQDAQVDKFTQISADLISLVLEEAQITTPERPFAPPWDVNWDFEVNIFDLVLVARHLGERVEFPFPNPDVDRSGRVDILDLVKVAGHFGERFDKEAQGAAPELFARAPSLEKLQPRQVGTRGVAGVMSQLVDNKNDRHFNWTHVFKHTTPMPTQPEKRVPMSAGVNPTKVWIQPGKVVENRLTVSVMADPVFSLQGYQLDVVHEETLEVAEVSEGTLLACDGTKTYFFEPKKAKGRVRVASVRMGQRGVDGRGPLATITFNVKESAQGADGTARYPRLELSGVKLSDSNGHLIPVQTGDALYLAEWTVPQQSALLPPYPNPANPETWIPFQLADQAEVTITIYNASGQPVRVLSLGQKPAGAYLNKARAAYWDGRNDAGEEVSSGIYFYSIKAGHFTDTQKIVLLK